MLVNLFFMLFFMFESHAKVEVWKPARTPGDGASKEATLRSK